MAYTAVLTYILLFIVDHIPGLSLRANEESEIVGIDEAECGELGYDYVSLRRDLDDNHVENNSGLTHVESRHSSNAEKKAQSYTTADVTETSAREGATAPAPRV
jgi:Amt family ammonium transporter